MTPKQFKKLALSLPEAVESEHMGHPDFRVAGKIFATLGWPNGQYGMVKLTSVQQATYIQAHPKSFQMINNGWGKKGATSVCLKQVTTDQLLSALKDAWSNTVPKKLISLLDE